jgi:hypothetical protein
MSYLILRGRWCNIIILNVHIPRQNKSDGIKDSFYWELGGVFEEFPGKDMKNLKGDLNAKVGREQIFKPTTGNESSLEISNGNGVRAASFATSKNLVVNSTTFPQRYIHEHTRTSPEGKAHRQPDHVLRDRRRHSSTLDVRSF